MSPSVSTSDVQSEDHKKLVEAYNHSIEQYNEDYNSLSSNIGQNRKMLNDIDNNLGNMSNELSNIDSSLDVVHSELDSLGGKLEAVYDLFERQTAKMYLVLELQNSNLKKIIFNLQRPLDIKAKELRLRAIVAYVHGWYDESLVDFEKSLKYNQYDFTIHLFLGHIYYYENQDRVKALDHYQKAVKYALPYSKRYASLSSLYVSLMYRMNNEFEKAYTETKKAVEYSQQNLEAKFQHSINCVSTNKTEEAITILEHLVYDKKKDIYLIFNNEELNKIKPIFVNLASRKLEILKDKRESIVEQAIQQNIEDKKRIDDMMKLINNPFYREYYHMRTSFFTLYDKLEKSNITKKDNWQQVSMIKTNIHEFYRQIKQDNPRLFLPHSSVLTNDQNIIKIKQEISSLGNKIGLLKKRQELLSEKKNKLNRSPEDIWRASLISFIFLLVIAFILREMPEEDVPLYLVPDYMPIVIFCSGVVLILLVYSIIHLPEKTYRNVEIEKIDKEISQYEKEITSLEYNKCQIGTSTKMKIMNTKKVHDEMHHLNQKLIKLIPSDFISKEKVENEWRAVISNINEYSNILNILTNKHSRARRNLSQELHLRERAMWGWDRK